jgi:hypothetical protein
MYIKTPDNYPYSLADLRRDHPQTSFPQAPPETLLAEFSVFRVQQTVPPKFDPLGQVLEESLPSLDGGGWLQQWTVSDLLPEQAAQNRTDAITALWGAIKAERDRRRFEGGVWAAGCWFKSDNQAVGEYTAMAMLGTSVPGTTVLRQAWRTMAPDTVIPMTPNLAKQILFAGFTSLGAIDDAALAHLAALQSSDNPSTYDFSSGWPAAYGEAA